MACALPPKTPRGCVAAACGASATSEKTHSLAGWSPIRSVRFYAPSRLRFGRFIRFCAIYIWLYMSIYGNIRPYIAIYSHICDYICLYMTIYTLKYVFWTSGHVFWVSELVFWVSGLVFGCLNLYLGVWTCIWVSGLVFWMLYTCGVSVYL